MAVKQGLLYTVDWVNLNGARGVVVRDATAATPIFTATCVASPDGNQTLCVVLNPDKLRAL